MTTTPVDAVEREVRVAARPETIFPFLTESEQMRRWMGISVEADPRPGGMYRVDIDGGGHVARGEFVEVTPPRRVVFTWGWEAADSVVRPGTSTVEVTLTPDGDHTIVRLGQAVVDMGNPFGPSKAVASDGSAARCCRAAAASRSTRPSRSCSHTARGEGGAQPSSRFATAARRSPDGRGWFRTTDLSRVKRALSH